MIEKLGCKRWRLQHLYKIADKRGEIQTFTFNQEQEQIYDQCFDAHGNLIVNPDVLKSRQIGITTFFVLVYLDDVLWTPNINAYIQSHKDDSIEKIFRIARFAYDNMDEEFKPEIAKGGGSKYEMHFPKVNSRIYVGLTNRSATIHRLHFSEVAFQSEIHIGVTLGALPKHLKYSRETTPNGANWYQDEWINKSALYKRFFFPWFEHQDYVMGFLGVSDLTPDEIQLMEKHNVRRGQIEFRRLKIAQLGKRLFIQEYPEDPLSCFLTSGNIVFEPETLSALITKKPIEIISDGAKIYRAYDTKVRSYVCGCDTAEGIATSKTDFSVAIIIDDLFRQCAVLRVKARPSDFAHMVTRLCSLYGGGGRLPPMLAVERNNHGHAVLLELQEHIRYTNLYFATRDKAGWITDRMTRPIMLNSFVDAIENESAEVIDSDTVAECFTLVENNGKIEAAEGKHDDCIIAMAIAIQIQIQTLRMPASANPADDFLL